MLLLYGCVIVPPEWHVIERKPPGYCRVYHILSGDVEYISGTMQKKLKHGMVYIFPSVKPYEIRQDPSSRLECTYMHMDFSPSVITDLVEITTDSDVFVRSLFAAIKASVTEGSEARTRVLSQAFEIYCAENGLTSEYEPRVSGAVSYISDNFRQDISVSDIVKAAGYNEQYFIRLFRESTGVTPYRYLVMHRLKEAQKCLTGDGSVTLIAEATGFGDINSFSRAFKREFGITPTGYRKKAVSP